MAAAGAVTEQQVKETYKVVKAFIRATLASHTNDISKVISVPHETVQRILPFEGDSADSYAPPRDLLYGMGYALWNVFEPTIIAQYSKGINDITALDDKTVALPVVSVQYKRFMDAWLMAPDSPMHWDKVAMLLAFTSKRVCSLVDKVAFVDDTTIVRVRHYVKMAVDYIKDNMIEWIYIDQGGWGGIERHSGDHLKYPRDYGIPMTVPKGPDTVPPTVLIPPPMPRHYRPGIPHYERAQTDFQAKQKFEEPVIDPPPNFRADFSYPDPREFHASHPYEFQELDDELVGISERGAAVMTEEQRQADADRAKRSTTPQIFRDNQSDSSE